MRKLFLFLALIVGLLASASTLQAQTANMSRYITLTVADGAAIKLDFMAAAAATPVRIVSGSNTQDITVGTGWYNSSFTSTFTVTAGSTTMTIYGDLTGFSCPKNGANLTAIDLSHNTELEELYCIGNQLTTLDVSHNRWLYKLYCSANRLTTLDVSYNTKLKKLNCSGNNFSSQALDDIYCSLPDRTGNTWGLIYPLNHESDPNHATVLATNKQNATAKNWNVRYFIDDTDIPPTTGTYTCPQLNISRYITLTVTNGAPIKLDFKAATNLTPIRIVNGSNTEDIIVGTSWYGTAPYTAGITTMTIHGDLTGFDCSGNGADLTAIDPSNNTQLEILYCKNNSINRLDVSQNTQLRGLYCSGNNLTSLDVSQNTKLIGLGCSENLLSYLDVSQNTQLKKLSCHVNDFTTATLDRIYCALPVRSASDGAQIFPLGESSSAAEQNKVASTNGANAIAKNWRVLKYKTDGTHTDIATTGSYVCSGGGGTTTYDLKIAGVDVTSANCSDLSVISGVSGTVKYDPTTKVLTLDGATIQKTDNTVAIESSIDGLTIKVIGTSNLTTSSVALSFRKPLTITGGGVLNANSGTTCAIYVNKINLTIDGCTVNAKGKWGIAGNDGSSETLTIKNSTVTAEGVTDGSIADFASLTLDGCAITQPAGAAFDASMKTVALGGAVVKSKVVISPTGGGKPNMSRYITLTVKSGENIRLDLKAATEGTPVRIVSGSNTQNIRVGTSWTGFSSYTADGTEMTVYGDIIGFDCSRNGANLIALEVSHNTLLKKLYCQGNDLRSLDISRNTHLIDLNCRDNKLSSLDVSNNTQLEELYCHNNNFTTAALDNIYCALPDRTGKTNGKILPIYNSSSSDHATVLATNAQNAIAKNWKVLYYDGNADITTTGKHKCSATDIAEATAEQALTLYPNPVADVLYLSATARTIRVYDIYGTEVAHATDTDRVEVSHLPAGVYTVRADGTVAKMVKR